jgi:vanillate O-demethylase monooxygenase subunit
MNGAELATRGQPNYPFNCWYVAATGDEVTAKPLGRRLLDLPVVLYRRPSGEVVAMEDRCVHRAFPLSVGRVVGDRIVCGYHGFEYGPDGACLRVPSQETLPTGACVRTYPVHEQGPFLWIWLGEPGSAALRPAPRTPWFEDPQRASTGTMLKVHANYMLLQEHYLDLTNVFVMHPEAVPPGIEELPQLGQVEVSEMSVSYSRRLPAAQLADWEAEATGLPRDTVCGRTEEGTFVSPALHVQRYTIEPEGQVFELLRVQAFTPESPDATHVFLHIVRDYATDRAVVAGHLQTMFAAMAERDARVLELVQQSFGEDGEPRRDLNVKADRAAVRARRVAQAMVAEEAGRRRRDRAVS